MNEQNSFWIRGQRSNSPDVLVLVDGQERDFAVLSSHEVESITVLKDAAATALYGMRAGSGAILVTTRKGAKGKPQVELTAQIIAQQPLKELKSLNAADYARQHNIARHNDNMDPLYSNYDIMNYAKNDPNSILYPNVDWADKYLKDIRWSQRYNLNIQGGTEKSTYFVNAMYTRNNGYFNTDNSHDYNTNHSAERFNIRSNIDFAVTRTTQLDVNLYGWYQSQNGPGSGAENIYKNLVTLPQGIFPKWYNDQGYTDQYGNVINAEDGKIVAGNAFRENPWAMLNRSGYFQDKQLYGSFRTKLSQDLSSITEGLKVSVALSMDSRTISSIRRTITFAYYEKDATNENVLRRTREDDSMINKVDNTSSFRRTGIVAQLDYNRTFGKHGVSALAFYEQYESNDEMVLPTRFQSVNGWFGYNYDKNMASMLSELIRDLTNLVRDTNSVSSLQYLPDGLFLTNLSGKMQKNSALPEAKSILWTSRQLIRRRCLLLQGTYVAAKRSLYHRGKHGNKAWRIHSGYTSKSRIDLGES